LPVVATLAELSEDALVEILTEPEERAGQAVRQAAVHGRRDLEVRPAALKAIARKALARKNRRARPALILEQSLIDTMFDRPNAGNVERVVVDESTIEDNKAPLLLYARRPRRPEGLISAHSHRLSLKYRRPAQTIMDLA